MKDLLDFIINNLIGSEYEISEETEEERTTFFLKVPAEKAGIVIGKGGNTIKAIQDILRIKATLEKKYVNIKVDTLQ